MHFRSHFFEFYIILAGTLRYTMVHGHNTIVIAKFFYYVHKHVILFVHQPYQIIVGHVIRYGKNLFLSVSWVCTMRG